MPKSKSAYSVPTKKQKSDTYIFVIWVDNEAGVSQGAGLMLGAALLGMFALATITGFNKNKVSTTQDKKIRQ